MKNVIYYKVLSILLFTILIHNNQTADAATTLNLEMVGANFSSPIFLTSPNADNRLFIVEQGGKIKIIQNDTTLTVPYLDISPSIVSGGELGLLGLAFHPNYVSNGYFYVNYTASINNQTYTKICRFKVDTTDSNLADISSEVLLLQQLQPFDNHNGGMLAFGPDGYLYAGFGDGGAGGDPNNNGQDGSTLLGSMIRIDIDSAVPYAIPVDNPFVSDISTLDEIWAIGIRNPWRFSFDRLTGDLYIGDVGQQIIEEIDFQPSSSQGGENYGWRLKEGSACYNPSSNCASGVTLTEPIYDYTHNGTHCSVTGGYVYRGSCLPEFSGMYFYADFCSATIWSFKYSNGVLSDSTEYAPTIPQSLIASFGEDSNGELYIISLNGNIYRIVPEGGSSLCNSTDCCQGIRGNVDGDAQDMIDIGDLVYLVDFMFRSGPPSPCQYEADINGSGDLDIADIVHFVEYMFGIPTGPSPSNCT